MHKYYIELNTSSEIQEFIDACSKVQSKVIVGGKDEHGSNWSLSVKSLLCVLVMNARLEHRHKTVQKADWNTIYVESEDEIYSLISKFIKECNNGEINK